MGTSLYDVSVGTYLQILGGVTGTLEKGRKHCEDRGVDLAEIVETSLYEDMLPFRFQIVSVAHHSLGAIQGVEAGVFGPPSADPGLDYAALEQLVRDAQAGLRDYKAETVNGFEGKDVEFKLGDFTIPFTAENFLLSFSLPNFYFHATTGYDILRHRGVPLGKRDFLGAMRVKQ